MGLTNRVALLVKSETTSGVDSVPDPSLNAVLISGLTIKVNGKQLARNNYRNTFSPQASVIGAKTVELSFETEVKGKGSAYASNSLPEIAALLRGAGMGQTLVTTGGSESVSYKPTSSGASGAATFSSYVHPDGALLKLVGCQATFSLDLKAGEYGKAKWTVKGKFVSWTDAALPAVTVSAVLPPMVESAGMALGAFTSGVYEAVNLSLENNIVERMDVNAVGGFSGFRLTGRNPKGSINPLMVSEATKSFWGNWEASVTEAMSLTIGSVQYNRLTITAPKVQLLEITPGDRNGERDYNIPISLTTGAAGDDELVLTFN